MKRIFAPAWKDYELIDCGNQKKLERWGETITIRPEINAYFQPKFNYKEWRKSAHFEFHQKSARSGEWESIRPSKKEWVINFNEIQFKTSLAPFKHTGVFPEQAYNWEWIENNVIAHSRFLNLFGYTGISSLVARKKKADVYHVDASKSINEWAKQNLSLNKFDDIHWVTDDALKFIEREKKRQNKYDFIFMDPPAHGIGANKKHWKLEKMLPQLLNTAISLLNNSGKIILNTYSPKVDDRKIKEIMMDTKCNNFKYELLCIQSKTGKTLEFGIRTEIIN